MRCPHPRQHPFGNTTRTSPLASSSANIHSEATATPISAGAAARTPSAAVTRILPLIDTEVSELRRRHRAHGHFIQCP
jgi:hypothetical protein